PVPADCACAIGTHRNSIAKHAKTANVSTRSANRTFIACPPFGASQSSKVIEPRPAQIPEFGRRSYEIQNEICMKARGPQKRVSRTPVRRTGLRYVHVYDPDPTLRRETQSPQIRCGH